MIVVDHVEFTLISIGLGEILDFFLYRRGLQVQSASRRMVSIMYKQMIETEERHRHNYREEQHLFPVCTEKTVLSPKAAERRSPFFLMTPQNEIFIGLLKSNNFLIAKKFI